MPPRRHPHPERMLGHGRRRQLNAYVRKTLRVGRQAEAVLSDNRRSPKYRFSTCFLLDVELELMRFRSFNAFESELGGRQLKRMFHGRAIPRCTQTIRDANKKADLASLEQLHQLILRKAARNKVLDKTRMHGVSFFAVDGVEPISSVKRTCDGCSVRVHKTAKGEVREYFHRFVFAQTIGPAPHLLLGFEPQASVKQRRLKEPEATKAQGEQTAAKPLIERLRGLFPRRFCAGVMDALFANGPMFTFMRQGRAPLDLIVVLKKPTDEPMADAVGVFKTMAPSSTYYDASRREHVRLWDSEGFEGLATCDYPLRVIKALVVKGPRRLSRQGIDWEGDQVHTWWLGTGLSQARLSGRQVFDVLRHRWDEENCAFNELTQHWHFKHAFQHHAVGTQVMMYALMIAYNLFQLFLHQCLRNFTHSRLAAIAIVEQMRHDYVTITMPQDGYFPPDTS